MCIKKLSAGPGSGAREPHFNLHIRSARRSARHSECRGMSGTVSALGSRLWGSMVSPGCQGGSRCTYLLGRGWGEGRGEGRRVNKGS